MKKVVIIGALALGAFLLFGKSNKADDATTPVVTTNVGFNADGTPRALTESEVQSYLQNNGDLTSAYNAGGPNIPADWSLSTWANWHWQNYGYKENRQIA